MAAELATRYPERVSRLVLVNPAGLYLPDAPITDIFGKPPAELAECCSPTSRIRSRR